MRRAKRSTEGESGIALQQAQLHLEEIKARDPEVSEVSKAMRILRERNHFAERLQALIIGGEGRTS